MNEKSEKDVCHKSMHASQGFVGREDKKAYSDLSTMGLDIKTVQCKEPRNNFLISDMQHKDPSRYE